MDLVFPSNGTVESEQMFDVAPLPCIHNIVHPRDLGVWYGGHVTGGR